MKEIAFLLGFAGTATFSRAFKRWTDVAPTGYPAKREAPFGTVARSRGT